MKAKLRLQIKSMHRENENLAPDAIMVVVHASGDGVAVTDVPRAKESRAEIALRLKPHVADALQFVGQYLFVTVSTEEEG